MPHVRTARATFVSDDQPDTTVSVVRMGEGMSFTLDLGGEFPLQTVSLAYGGRSLQLAESLQFVVDTISTDVPDRLTAFTRGWINTAADIHHTAKQKGWWPEDVEERNKGEAIALIHQELSEALEGLRQGNPPDDKLPEFTNVEVEMADAVIRIMDMAHAHGWRVAQAIEAKMAYNVDRPHKHGKEF